jgi:hypothetical protein
MRRIGRLLLTLDVHEELCPPAGRNGVFSWMGQHFLGVGHRLLTVAGGLGSEGAVFDVFHRLLNKHVRLRWGVHCYPCRRFW